MTDSPKPREIFVFGSNLAGKHGRGAAYHARKVWGARYGIGVGPQGNAYAIPTKDTKLNTLPLIMIRQYVGDFLRYAQAHPELTFKLTAIGCGLAGYKAADIAPMFASVPENVLKPVDFGGTYDPLAESKGAIDADPDEDRPAIAPRT